MFGAVGRVSVCLSLVFEDFSFHFYFVNKNLGAFFKKKSEEYESQAGLRGVEIEKIILGV